MLRLVLVLLAGVIVGSVASWLTLSATQPGAAPEVVRDIVVVETMSDVAAEEHREDGFRDLATIEQVYALPTEFGRREALFALAGRSDAEAVQALIFDANRIADETDRNAALNVLFFRLTELDAPSALALARTEYFRTVKEIERGVWHAWGRIDLDDALAMAGTLRGTRRSFAAQALYTAFGLMGNETTDRIEAELGVQPDRNTRGRFLYKMADRSLAEAIRFINDSHPIDNQQQMAWWLAHYVSLDDPQAALQSAHLFENQRLQQSFSTYVQQSLARNDPQAALAQLVASGDNLQGNAAFHGALGTLAASDRAAALEFYASLTTTADRSAAASVIASAIARDDPEEALQWGRENAANKQNLQLIEMSILRSVVEFDPKRAIFLAQSIDGPGSVEQISNVVVMIAQSNPRTAEQYLGLISDPRQRKQAQSQLAMVWMQSDTEAAVDWILGHDEETATALLNQSVWHVVSIDTDLAIRLLPRLGQEEQRSMRGQIAARLARTSPAEAQAFIRRFAAADDYPDLQASVIAGIADNDPAEASRLVNQISDQAVRDRTYTALVTRQSYLDPREALAMTEQIVDENQRAMATAHVAQVWAQSDPASALRIVRNLPPGRRRDQAITALAQTWQDPTRDQLALIDSIEDDRQRNQTQVMLVYSVANSDPDRARRMADQLNLSEEQRRSVEELISHQNSRRLRIYD